VKILGTKQSGEQNFIFADLGRDLDLLLASNKYAITFDYTNIHPQLSFILKLFAQRDNNKDILE
jgi:RecG-like helicase